MNFILLCIILYIASSHVVSVVFTNKTVMISSQDHRVHNNTVVSMRYRSFVE